MVGKGGARRDGHAVEAVRHLDASDGVARAQRVEALLECVLPHGAQLPVPVVGDVELERAVLEDARADVTVGVVVVALRRLVGRVPGECEVGGRDGDAHLNRLRLRAGADLPLGLIGRAAGEQGEQPGGQGEELTACLHGHIPSFRLGP